jgi:hypothetical protein
MQPCNEAIALLTTWLSAIAEQGEALAKERADLAASVAISNPLTDPLAAWMIARLADIRHELTRLAGEQFHWQDRLFILVTQDFERRADPAIFQHWRELVMREK